MVGSRSWSVPGEVAPALPSRHDWDRSPAAAAPGPDAAAGVGGSPWDGRPEQVDQGEGTVRPDQDGAPAGRLQPVWAGSTWSVTGRPRVSHGDALARPAPSCLRHGRVACARAGIGPTACPRSPAAAFAYARPRSGTDRPRRTAAGRTATDQASAGTSRTPSATAACRAATPASRRPPAVTGRSR